MGRRETWHEAMTSNYININNEFSNTQRASPKNKSIDFGISSAKTTRTENSPKSTTNQLAEFRRFKRVSETIFTDSMKLQPQKIVRKASGSPSSVDALELIDQHRFFKNKVNSKTSVTKLKLSTDNNKISPRKSSIKKSITGSETSLKQNPQAKIEVTEPIKISTLAVRSSTKHKTMVGYPSIPFFKLQYSTNHRSKASASDKLSFSATPGLKISSIGSSTFLEHAGKDYSQTPKNSSVTNRKYWNPLSVRVSTHH